MDLTWFIKVNVDEAVRDTFTIAAAVLRDCNGLFKGASTSAIKLALISPLDAEAATTHFRILKAQRRGFNNIIIKGGSGVVVFAINSFPRRVEWRIHGVIGDIRSDLPKELHLGRSYIFEKVPILSCTTLLV